MSSPLQDKNAYTAETLVRAMDRIGSIIANASATNTTVIVGRNLAMEAKKIDPNTEVGLKTNRELSSASFNSSWWVFKP